MLSRTLATMALGVLALCSGAAMAQGHEGGHENGGATARAVAYHGGHYSYHYGGYRGSYGYPGWYGPSVGVYVGAPAYGLWGYPYYPGAVYGPSAAIPYPPMHRLWPGLSRRPTQGRDQLRPATGTTAPILLATTQTSNSVPAGGRKSHRKALRLVSEAVDLWTGSTGR